MSDNRSIPVRIAEALRYLRAFPSAPAAQECADEALSLAMDHGLIEDTREASGKEAARAEPKDIQKAGGA